MAVGTGAWFLALGATLVVWVVLVVVRWFSKNGKHSSSAVLPH
jgi:uncharacterized membrane protein YhiD involved in acid resistance